METPYHPDTSLPYWQINVPPSHRTPTCPPFLRTLSPKDLSIISTPDSSYTPLPWPSVKHLVQEGKISVFDRKPSDLRRYLEYCWELKQKWGSVVEFVLKERLGWEGEMEVKDPKWGEGNVRVLWNDWPYGIEEGIAHLVVWTKFWLEEVEGEDRLVEGVKMEIEEYVQKTFVEEGGMKAENVIWFKNWRSLKSVHAVEHFHVLIYQPNLAFIDKLTGGDVPLSKRIKEKEEV